jgi:hypothetical protein
MQHKTRARSHADPHQGHTARSSGASVREEVPEAVGRAARLASGLHRKKRKKYAGLSPCSCGYCNGGFKVATLTDTHSAEVQAVERQSRAVVCPNCGGYNDKLRRRYTAHICSYIRRHNIQKWQLKFVTVALEKRAVKAANLSGYTQSHRILTGDRGAHTLLNKRLRYHTDGQLRYFGFMGARPSDHLAHTHLLCISGLSAQRLQEIAHVRGLDVDVKTPRATDSADDFAGCVADYCFDNAVRAELSDGSHTFTASNGIGYYSEAARTHRKAYVEKQKQKRNDRAAQHPEQPSDTRHDTESKTRRADSIARKGETGSKSRSGSPDVGGESAVDDTTEGRVRHRKRSRPPPIRGKGTVCKTEQEVKAALREALRPRCGTPVPMQDGSVAVLHQLHRYPLVEVRVIGEARIRTVDWRSLSMTGAPKRLETITTTTNNDTAMPDNDSDKQADKQTDLEAYDALHDRFEEAARYSRVTVDGRTTIKDHETGQVFDERLPEDE